MVWPIWAVAAIGAVAGGVLGAGSKDPQTITENEFDPVYLRERDRFIEQASELFSRDYEGEFIAGPDPAELSGLLSQLATAQSPAFRAMAASFSQNLMQSAREIGSLANLDPDQNRALASQLSTLTGDVNDFFQKGLTGLQEGAQQQGAFGGTRAAVQEAAFAGEAGRALAAGEASLLQNERNLIAIAPSLFQQGVQAGQLPGLLEGEIGTKFRGLSQLENDEYYRQFVFPQEQLEREAALISSFLNKGPVTTTATNKTSTAQKFLQGAIGGASAATSFTGGGGGGGAAGGSAFQAPQQQQRYFQPQPYQYQPQYQSYDPYRT